MPVITIVTAVREGMHEYLADAYESLLAQKLPPGWTWQWVVQEDGTSGVPLHALPLDDARISAGIGRAGRAATARTLGLTRATGVLIRTLDADDVLMPGALAHDIDVLTTHPGISWTVSSCLDLLPDGTTVPGPRDPDPGPLTGQFLTNAFRDDRWPVVGATMTAYTDLIRAVGGWPAIPALEDVGIVLACAAVSDGWMIPEPSLYYRKWPGQSTQQQDYFAAEEKQLRRDVCLQWVDALSLAGWRWSPKTVPTTSSANAVMHGG